MARKKGHNPIYRGTSIVLSILFLWGFGVMLLMVIMNISIGFADDDAEFRQAFLERIEYQELPEIRDYIETNEQQQQGNLDAYLSSYRKKFAPENTNLRFAATDMSGNLLLTNDPAFAPDNAMASDVQTITVTTEQRTYTELRHFDDPLTAYSAIVYGDNSQRLENPEDFKVWFFSDDDIMAAFNGGLDVRVFSDLYTTYRSFRTVAEAEAFDYEAEYGELCTHKIESSSAVSVAEGADLTGEDSEAESFGEHRIAVQIQAYNSIVDQHISLENYYDQKVLGTEIYAVNAQLEEKLMKGLDITIRAEHTELMQCRLLIYLPETLEVRDSIRADYTVFHSLFRRGEGSVVLMFVFMVLAVLVCIVMCSAAGYTDDSGVIRANRIHGIFYELFWLLPAVLLLGSYAMVQILFHVNSSYRMIAIFCVGMILMLAVSCVLWLYTTSIRAKNGTFWSSFGTYRLFRFIFSLFSNATAATFGTVAYSIFLFVLNGLVMRRVSHPFQYGILFIDLLTLVGIAYCIYAYFELHKHVRQMETGDFSPAEHPVPLAVDFSRFDRSLNEITDRVGEIVAKQTKAEHLRTELITNVSHDLKTPLTSIVNYVDLLSREPMQTETASEYLEVLQRQAARLKKLTVDLVDASKASTGNLTVELVPTDIRVLLSQLAGEYEEQLAAHDLILVQNLPEESVTVLADGRQIWRVFDNLLNNACKYALPGTRVYLDARCEDGTVEIVMKNISATPLNISADALMERFVRGDASRHTEGSGLGLSIARDLTALQNGVLDLKTDGDLFKAILRFPVYHAPEDNPEHPIDVPYTEIPPEESDPD